MQPYVPSRSLRSCDQGRLLCSTRLKVTEPLQQWLPLSGTPLLWDWELWTLISFKKQLKTHLFKLAFVVMFLYFLMFRVFNCEALCDFYLERCYINKILLTYSLCHICIHTCISTHTDALHSVNSQRGHNWWHKKGCHHMQQHKCIQFRSTVKTTAKKQTFAFFLC